MAIFEGADNIAIDEDAQGRPFIENTATGTRVSLGDFVDIVGGIGSEAAPVAGTSYFEDLVSDSVRTANAPTADNDVLRWQEGVETKTVTAMASDRSGGSDGWDDFAVQDVSVSWDSTFDSVPHVTTGLLGDELSAGFLVNVTNITTSGCDVQFFEYHAQDNSTREMEVHLMATEGR